MSFLIEMPHVEVQNPEEDCFMILAQQISMMVQHSQLGNINIHSQSQDSVVICLNRGEMTFIRDSRWNVEIKNHQLRIWVAFVQRDGLNYIRAQSQRMKLQLMILLRFINSKLPIQQEFFVQPQTGLIRYSFIIMWKDYRQKIKGPDGMTKLIKYMLSQLNIYAQALLFCQPQAPEMQVGQSMYSQPRGMESINRYRFLMRGTRKFRESNMGIVDQAVALKNQLKRNPSDENTRRQLQQLTVMFQNNISAYEQMRVGLEDPQPKDLGDCLKHISKAGEGKESSPPNSNIVSGIKILKQQDIKPLSKEGAHSQILKGKFLYKIYKTINPSVIQNQESLWTDGKQNKSELILKSCSMKEQSSKNSFMNEIDFLNHIRDSRSSYIAKYYLNIKRMEERNEMDYIYMRPYVMNLYGVVRRCKTFSLEQRLSISYKVSKGLCFLSSKSILHRDFKPHNVMIDQGFNPFIIDFGSCAPIYHDTTFKVHEERLLTTKMFHIYYHQIPEEFAYVRSKFTREEYNRHPLFDVYSFGKVLSFIFFDSLTPPNPEDIASRPCPQLLKNILYIIMLCLQIDPDERPTFSQIQSFLGTLKTFLSSVPQIFQQKIRSLSEPKPSQNNF